MELREVILGDGGKKSLLKGLGAPGGAKSPSATLIPPEEGKRFGMSAKHVGTRVKRVRSLHPAPRS